MKISSLRPGWLVLVFVIAGAAGWLMAFIAAEKGWVTPVLGTTAVLTLAGAGVLLLVLGLRIRSDRAKPIAQRINPIAAVRTLVLAQATAYAGTLLAGWHAGVLTERIPITGVDNPAVVQGLIQGGVGLAVLVIGLVVEAWCRVPPDDEEDQGETPGNRGPVTPGYPAAPRNKM